MRRLLLAIGLVAIATFNFGCALTDFSGWAGHNTQAEAKLWGTDIAFITGDDQEGTYAYTVRYDNRGGQGVVTINSYRNAVVSAFTRDGIVDMDGDNVQGSAGSLTGVPATPAGKFLPFFKAVDATGGATCEFTANLTFNKSVNLPGVALCTTTNEEIDNDFDLAASFANLDDLLSQIWSGALTGSFAVEVNGITLDGVGYPVAPVVIGAAASGLRPSRFTIDLTQPNAASLVQTLLDNTQHGVAYDVGLSFSGGLSINLPASMKVAFNHDYLWGLL